MKKVIRLRTILLALVLAAALLTGCGRGGKTDYSAIQQGVVKGSSVFVTDSNVVFFGYGELLCTALFDSGEVYDFVVEAGFTGEVYALAVYDGYLYVSASDGMFRYDLEMFSGSGAMSPEVVWDGHLSRYNPFQIYDGKIFFLYGTTLCCVPVEGGDKIDLTVETGDFEVTSDGIYYSKKDGSLHLLSSDLTQDKEVGHVAAASYLTMGNGSIYYRDGSGLWSWSMESGESAEVATQAVLQEYCYPWYSGGILLYNDVNFHLRQISDRGEKDAGSTDDYPFKYSGYVYGDWLISQTADYDKLKVIGFADGSVTDYDLSDEMASYISEIYGSTDQQDQDTQRVTEPDEYNILAGMQTYQDGSVMYFYGNDFMLTMPNTDDWEYTQETPDSFSIYLTEARTDGYGGHLVTIKAYDLDDDSYTQLPSYSVAGIGLNADKRFVAIFPTDVQYDPSNQAQADRYRELLAYLQKIGQGAVNSPFQTSDSD